MDKAREKLHQEAIKKALAKMNPEVRKIVRKYCTLSKVYAVVKAGEVEKVARQMADELITVAMKRRKLVANPYYWLKRYLRFVRSFRK